MERSGVNVIERDLGCIALAVNAQSAIALWDEQTLQEIAGMHSAEAQHFAMIDLVRFNGVMSISPLNIGKQPCMG